MSWSLSLDRAPRSRKQTTYSDTTRYKEVTNDDDNLSKKKRGRPPRTSGHEIASDGSTQPKRRGRPPKFPKLQSTNSNTQKTSEDQSKIAKYKITKKYESSSSHSSDSDVEDDRDYYSVDYAYEYEYEYENENSGNEGKFSNIPMKNFPQNPPSQIEINQQKPPKPINQTKNPLIPLRQMKKVSKPKGKLINDSSLSKNDSDFYIVQEIIGKHDNFLAPKNTPNQYFVKFDEMPYKYCRWLSAASLSKYEGGEIALKKFIQRCESDELIRSISIPHLLIISDKMAFTDKNANPTEILTQWFEVDRIFGIANINNNNNNNTSGNDGSNSKSNLIEDKNDYLVKWKELDYDSFSVENLESFEDSAAIFEYKLRLSRMNPKKIPIRWVHPNISQLVKVTQLPVSKNGEVFRDFQLEGLNWLIECWYQRRFSIFGDMTREGKIPQLINMLNFLSTQFQINGPFLVLASDNQVVSWKEHFDNWSNLNVVVLAGNTSSRQITIDNEIDVHDDHGRLIQDYIRCDVVLTAYKTFLSNSQNLMEIEWRYVIADDGSKMKNSRGRIRNLIKQLKYEHITLSMEWEMLKPKNDYQIYFLMNFINPQLFNNFNDFVNTFVPYEGEKMIQLNKIVEPFILTRDVDMIKEKMKPKEEIIIIVQPSIIQKRLYIEAVKSKTEILMKPITDQADYPLTQLIISLRQLINHPILASIENDNQEILSDLTKTSGKMYFIDLLLKDLVPQKKRVMIFSQFVAVLDVLEFYLRENEVNFERIDSMTTADNRIAIINRYKTSETSVFLFSSKPGSFQIDLNLFDYVVIYDKDNYFFYSEMRGTLYRLVTDGSFEMNRAGKSETITSFDEQTLQYLTHLEIRPMDAEDIEIMLRDSIRPMFDKNDDKIISFFSKSLPEILSECVKKPEMSEEDDTIVDIQKQKKFWNELLKPPQPSKKDNASVSPDQVTRARQLINSLIDHGYQGGNDQLDLLKCALTLNPPKEDKNDELLQYLNEIVGDNSSDEPVHRFGSWAFLIDKLASKMFDNVCFFARLHRALFYTSREDLIWPPISPSSSSTSSPNTKESQTPWKDFDPLDEYTLMYTLDLHGFKQLSSYFEKAKELKAKQIEKRLLIIIKSIENQYSVSDGFPQISRKNDKKNPDGSDSGSDLEDDEMESVVSDNENDPSKFIPLTPEEWSRIHPNLVVRNSLADDDIDRIFEVLNDFGIPLLEDNKPDIAKFISIAELGQISVNLIENCLEEFIKIGLSLLNSKEDQEQRFANEKYDQLLRGKFTNKQYLNIIFVCRMMSKVYSFFNEHKFQSEKDKMTNLKELFEKVQIPNESNYSSSQIAQFFFCLIEFGVNDTEHWSNEFGSTVFPSSSDSRLQFASKIIDNYRSSKVIKSTSKLNIFNFGQFVDLPSFIGKNCPYPIGFLSVRCLASIVDEEAMQQKWFRCEIQSVAFYPVFVVITNLNKNEFVDASPFEAWKLALQSSDEFANAANALEKTQLNGDWLFGLSHPDIIDTVLEISKKKNKEKISENSHSENSDDA